MLHYNLTAVKGKDAVDACSEMLIYPVEEDLLKGAE